jgi:hypothetical protein
MPDFVLEILLVLLVYSIIWVPLLLCVLFVIFCVWMARRQWRFTSRDALIAMAVCSVLFAVLVWWVDVLVNLDLP